MTNGPFHLCPKCNRRLAAAGEATIDDRTLHVFQCDECIRVVQFDGVPFDSALTFAVEADGTVVDSTTGDPIDPASLRARSSDGTA